MDTPLGVTLVRLSEAGVRSLALKESSGPIATGDKALGCGFMTKRAREVAEKVKSGLDGYFNGLSVDFDTIRLDLRGTEFELSVWRALKRVPFGSTVSYGELAAAAGSPRGARAIGRALGKNPVPIIVPCHRVIESGGGLGGFSMGLNVKRRLLAIEGVSRGWGVLRG